jgi:hypothetical protein
MHYGLRRSGLADLVYGRVRVVRRGRRVMGEAKRRRLAVATANNRISQVEVEALNFAAGYYARASQGDPAAQIG